MNHHGRTRTLGGTDEKDDKDEETPDTLHNNWVGESGTLELDLISPREDVQVYIQQKLPSHEVCMFVLYLIKLTNFMATFDVS